MDAPRAVGFWLKLLDRLIERDLDRVLAPFELTRRDWQILNLLRDSPRAVDAIDAELAMFTDRPSGIGERLEVLISSGWVELNETGEAVMAANARHRFDAVLTSVSTARRRIAAGVERADYETTISTLTIMCQNLGWDGAT